MARNIEGQDAVEYVAQFIDAGADPVWIAGQLSAVADRLARTTPEDSNWQWRVDLLDAWCEALTSRTLREGH